MNYITGQHLGIILVVMGTTLLAFSVKVKRLYSGDIERTIDDLKKQTPELLEPTETYVSRPLFWSGLLLVAFGSVLQW